MIFLRGIQMNYHSLQLFHNSYRYLNAKLKASPKHQCDRFERLITSRTHGAFPIKSPAASCPVKSRMLGDSFSSSYLVVLPSAWAFLVACLINRRTLSYTIVVTFPDDIGIRWKGKKTLKSLTRNRQHKNDE